jgi:diguanylate cyclase (GGDEF)-like protein/PAS domain S-box-containing protein
MTALARHRAGLFAALVLLVLAHGMAWAGPLVFLGNARIEPVVFERGGSAQGVAVDLTRAMAAHAGLQVDVQAVEWQAAQARVLAGQADALIQINPSAEREKLYDFSDVLLDSHFHLFIPSGLSAIHDLQSLDGQRVGVEGGGFPIQYLKPHTGIQLVTVPSWHAAFEMLREGKLDAVFVDRWVGEYELSISRMEGITAVEPPLVSSQSRIAVKKGNSLLLSRINAGLADMARDGTRQAILERWQGKQVVYVTRQDYERREWLLAFLAIGFLSLSMAALALHIRVVRRRNAELLQVQAQLKSALEVSTRALDDTRQAKEAMEVLVAEQRAVLSSDFIGLIRVDLQSHTLLWANNAACRMLGYLPGALASLPTRTLFASDEDFAAFSQKAQEILLGGGTLHEEIRQKRRDGGTGWYQISASLLKDSLAVAAIVDVTERKATEDEAAYLAYFDPLTGLANRRMLNSRINLALAQSKRSHKHGALIFLDLDNFKPLNDRYGHELGDLMLQEVANRMVACVREVDTVARFGGDEFVVLLGELDKDSAKAAHMVGEVAEKIRKSLATPYPLQVPGAGPAVTHLASASIGVALFGNGLPAASELLMQGDAAMYAAKTSGRNVVRFFEAGDPAPP